MDGFTYKSKLCCSPFESSPGVFMNVCHDCPCAKFDTIFASFSVTPLQTDGIQLVTRTGTLSPTKIWDANE